MGNWIGLPGHVQISVIADVIIHNLQWLVVVHVHDCKVRRDGGLAVHAVRRSIDSRPHRILFI